MVYAGTLSAVWILSELSKDTSTVPEQTMIPPSLQGEGTEEIYSDHTDSHSPC